MSQSTDFSAATPGVDAIMGPRNKFAAGFRNFLGVDRGRRAAGPLRGVKRRSAAVGVETLEGRALMAAFSATGPGRGAANPAVIKALAAEAYMWGLAPEFVQRFSTYNTTLSAPLNALTYVGSPAAWNNAATNAGDSSVLYINGFLDFGKAPALVLTVPPSSQQYYVVNYLDDYVNTIESIGTRTTPSDVSTSYLLVGPNSPYARLKTVRIHGYEYRVMASDTNLNWMLIRVAANVLAAASDPQSVPSVNQNVVQKFALNTLGEFQRNGHKPVYPASYAIPDPTPAQVVRAEPYRNTPTQAVSFFRQLGESVKRNPIPTRRTGLSGTPLDRLPAWVVPQYGARDRYVVPSAGQQGILRAFAPLGLTRNGFRVPRNWRAPQFQALQAGYEQGQQNLNAFISSTTASSSTNYWTILNTIIGTYPSNQKGYEVRSAIVLNGGSANVPLDAVYPTLKSYMGTGPLSGDNTYSLTFTPPGPAGAPLPAVGTIPPLVEDANGNPKGFWSVVLYQPDPSEVAAPFLSQASVLNTHYSTADAAVLSVDAATDVVTVSAPTWGTIAASAPILFSSNASEYGLEPNAVYYVASTPTTASDPATGGTTYSFKISSQWLQTLSPANVPVQNSGGPGPVVDLESPAGASPLSYGVVKPVSQLGSPQLAAGQLAMNADGSLTLWFAPSLPAGVAASNWIPTPSAAYFNTLYPNVAVSTDLQIILRMYYPTPGDAPPSVLPYNSGNTTLTTSYVPPELVLVS